MLISRTWLRATCLTGAGPGECLEQVNNLLSAENEQMMFVTCFYGEFDLRTGTFVFTNCGHNPPLLAQGDGTVSPLEATDGMALAVRSEEHTSELQSLMRISYAVLCLKKKNSTKQETHNT